MIRLLPSCDPSSETAWLPGMILSKVTSSVHVTLGLVFVAAIAFQQCVDNFHVVYSYEAPQAKLAELSEEQVADPDAYGALPNFRLRVLPVLGTMPAIIGMAAASFVLCELANKKFVPRKVEPVSQAFAHKLQNRLVRHEAKVFLLVLV